jgi:hypothetical protein
MKPLHTRGSLTGVIQIIYGEPGDILDLNESIIKV